MGKFRLDQWCRKATSGIRYEPDRFPVYWELYAHGEELYEGYVAKGLSPREAEAKALEDLGSAEELIPLLAKAHPPHTGLLLQWTRRILAVLLAVALVASGFFIIENFYLVPAFSSFDAENNYPFAGETVRLLDLEPHVQARSDGYTFTLSRAVLYAQTLNGEGGLQLNLQVRSFHPIPWMEAPGFSSWFWAVNSLGNYYYAENQDSIQNNPAIRVTDYRTGLWTCTHDFWLIPCISGDAEWVELHYDRAGRNVVLHLDLTEGGAK